MDDALSDDPSKEPAAQPARVPICRVDQIYSKKDRRQHFVKSAKPTDKKNKFSKYVIVVRRIISLRGVHTETLIDVRGPLLRDVLAEIFKDAEGLRLKENPPVIAPEFLFHAAGELYRRLKAEPQDGSSELAFELGAAMQFIEETFSGDMASLQSLLQEEEITFPTLWQILPPNELVFAIDAISEPVIYRATKHEIKQAEDGSNILVVTCKFHDYDGKKFGVARSRALTIPNFPGSKKISELPLFPLRFHPEKESIREQLLARGKKRLQLRGRQFKEYHGHGLQEKEQGGYEKFNSHGRVIIDHAVYDQFVPNNAFVPTIDRGIPADSLTDDQILTFPSILYGFSFGDKIWGGFAVSRISDVQWNDAIFESLVMPTAQKHLISSLVKSHVAQGGTFDDFVRDKGKGLVGLLTGPPGVGKTLTAEAVAEIVRRPLYMLSSGELGDQPRTMDITLTKTLELTQTWGAVLLLDEADVFLARRDDTNLVRNAVVSIFLRQLEYYQGILILTTNRVESIDEAFQSRIHFCHNYAELDHAARKSIWRGFVRKVAGTPGVSVDIDEAGIEKLAETRLNGRQIKNTVKIAQSMAFEEKKPLTVEGIRMVTDLLQNFRIAPHGEEVSLL